MLEAAQVSYLETCSSRKGMIPCALIMAKVFDMKSEPTFCENLSPTMLYSGIILEKR